MRRDYQSRDVGAALRWLPAGGDSLNYRRFGEVQGLLGGLVGLLTLRESFAGWGLAIDHVKAGSRADQAENAPVLGVMP